MKIIRFSVIILLVSLNWLSIVLAQSTIDNELIDNLSDYSGTMGLPLSQEALVNTNIEVQDAPMLDNIQNHAAKFDSNIIGVSEQLIKNIKTKNGNKLPAVKIIDTQSQNSTWLLSENQETLANFMGKLSNETEIVDNNSILNDRWKLDYIFEQPITIQVPIEGPVCCRFNLTCCPPLNE